MEYEQSNVIKDFPGLYASESQKINNRESDYSEDEKLTRKDLLTGKKKDKKDKKDKEKGYAALEGESSADEGYEISPTKSKKSKSFKFASKSKEKREKSRDKEKDFADKKKEKDKRIDKKSEKEKGKNDKKERPGDIAEELPIFGVPLELAVERSRCHDGVDLPLPYRACIDYLQMYGLGFEYIYKISSPKSKVLHLKKMYNHREFVDLAEHDVPTITGLLKMFLRDLPESIFTSELIVRFEEAGAILNVAMREKHLKILVGNLPPLNYMAVSWLIVHLYTVTLNEKSTKMNAQSIAATLSSTLQISQRLLTALLCHCPALFVDVKLIQYIPPLISTAQLPDEKDLMEIELKKQESLLSQIHSEMNAGFVSKQREELLWEVQRLITQLKRKIRSKNRVVEEKGIEEKVSHENTGNSSENLETERITATKKKDSQEVLNTVPLSLNNSEDNLDLNKKEINNASIASENVEVKNIEWDFPKPTEVDQEKTANVKITQEIESKSVNTLQTEDPNLPLLANDKEIMYLNLKNQTLLELKNKLIEKMEIEKKEIARLKLVLKEVQYKNQTEPVIIDSNSDNLDKIMELLQNENQILHIKKINLVRKIMEEHEICIDLSAKLMMLTASC
ncbi:ralA-binding protein 1 isoform X2 [Agrilus planipennis]|uniref:RalA-binding protein 1 isoform X2 n=1 Tax=Agrilus planipennis TaxID=224129 RepID=A0A1W4XBS4_AGRPL|nr:ralA-binding protein 1 isoform X2 [Agrilus planipennis]